MVVAKGGGKGRGREEVGDGCMAHRRPAENRASVSWVVGRRCLGGGEGGV